MTSTSKQSSLRKVPTPSLSDHQIDPEDFETNFNLGVLYFEHKKDYDRAIEHLKLAINEEENATACFNLAIIYDEKGLSQDAMKTYQKVIRKFKFS